MKIRLPNGWRPRSYQIRAWSYLEHGGKRAVIVWPRRAGKDDIALHHTACKAIERPAVYWHMLPEAAQARKAIWDAVNPHTGMRRIDEAFPHEIRHSTHEQEMRIRLKNGSVWQLVGSDNFNSLVGSPPAGIVFSEWALARPEAWSFMRPILAENDGWAIWVYTPRGDNHGLELYNQATREPAWFCERLTVDDTKHIAPDILEAERRQMRAEHGDEDGEALFQQEYHASFSAPRSGSYYGSAIDQLEREGRIGDVPYDPRYPVTTGWDLGKSNATVIWCAQVTPTAIHVIDHYRATGADLDHYVGWLRSKPYVYQRHGLPHDVKFDLIGANGSRWEQLRLLGLQGMYQVPITSVDERIASVHGMLRRCRFDVAHCAAGLKALRSYHRDWDAERRAYKQSPVHDWSSDDADAFGYLSQSLTDAEMSRQRAIPPPDIDWIA